MIITLSDSSSSLLFTAPLLPGNFYNVSLSLYSDTELVEQTTSNVTEVLGVPLDE